MSSTKAILATFILFAASPLLHGQSYKWHPNSILYLGGGFDPRTPLEQFLPCISHGGPALVDTSGAVTTTYEARIIRSRKELYSHLNIDIGLAAQSAFSGGSGSFSFENEYQFQEDSVVWMIGGTTQYSREVLTDPKLNTEASALRTAGNVADFTARCGTHYVSQQTRYVTIAAVFTLRNVSTQEKTRFEAMLSGHTSFGAFSASASASYREFVQAAQSVSAVSFSFWATGGAGLTALATLPTSPDNLPAIQQRISEYMTTLTRVNAPPAGFSTASFSHFFPTVPNIDVVARAATLEQIFLDFRSITALRDRISAVLRDSSGVYSNLDPLDLARLRQQHGEISTQLADLQRLARACQSGSECVQVALVMPTVDWPEPISRPTVERINWYSSSNRWTKSEYFVKGARVASAVAINRRTGVRIGQFVITELADGQKLGSFTFRQPPGQFASFAVTVKVKETFDRETVVEFGIVPATGPF